MFKKRALEVKVVKSDKNAKQETSEDTDCFKDKAEFVLRRLESTGSKMFLGMCVYILLDTYRQVQIAKNTNVPTS